MKKLISLLTALLFIFSSLSVFADEDISNEAAINNETQAEPTETVSPNQEELQYEEQSDIITDDTGTEEEQPMEGQEIEVSIDDESDEITGFGTIDPDTCGSMSKEEETEFLESLNTNSDVETAAFTGSGWQSCGTMTSARSYMSSVVIDNNIYTFGGKEGDSVTDKSEVYNTSTESWTSKSAMPQARYKHTAVLVQDKVYICGGYDSNNNAVSDISVYDVNSNKWLDDIKTPNNNTNYSAGVYNNELYIFSGKENGISMTRSYKYNFETGHWAYITAAPSYTSDAAIVGINRGFYLINNFNIYEYNVQDNTWTLIDKLSRQVYDCAFVNRGDGTTNELYVTGGRDYKNSGNSIVNTKYRYDTDSLDNVPNWKAEWYNDIRMVRGLACHNMVIADGTIYVFGGQITYGEDQKLMFKRSINDTKDDYPDNRINTWTDYIYGSINNGNDVDKFEFVPEDDGYYEISHYNPIQSNNLKYAYNIKIKERFGKVLVDNMYTNAFGAVYMKAGKTYYIDIFDIQGSRRGNYMYRIGKVDDDVPDDLDSALSIPLESNIDRNFIGKDDVDCFKFVVKDRGKFDIRVTNEEPDLYGQYTIADAVIYDSKKNDIYSFDTYDSDTYSCQLNAGTYYAALKPMSFYYDTGSSDYTINIHNTAKMSKLYNNRVRHGMENIDGKLYAVSGLNNRFDDLNNIEVYNPETKLWSTENKSDIKKDATIVYADNKIYTLGGYNNGTYYSDIKSYDTKTQAWRNEGNLNTARGRAAAIADERYIYIIGGRNSNSYIDTIEVFDTAAAKVTNTIGMPEALIEPQAFFNNGILYIVGGTSYDGYSDRVYAYENDNWTQKTHMPYVSEYIRGKGYENDFLCAAVNSSGNIDLMKYTSSTDKWSVIRSDYIDNLIYYGFDILNYRIYITGGYSYDKNEVQGDVYSYDFITDISKMDKNIPVRTVGYEYEQTNNSSVNNPPEILNVNAKVLDKEKGIYELYLDEDDYTCDSRSVPFFFWSAREGMFEGASEDYTRVIFHADPNTGDRKVKVVVGIGDGRGYADKKSFLLDGNNETE